MPKGSRHMSRKGGPPGKARKSRKARQYARPNVPVAPRQAPTQAGTVATLQAVRQASAARPAVPLYHHVSQELKRSAIIAAALLILLAILSIVL